MNSTISSVNYDQHQIIKDILQLHTKNKTIDCDPTYSVGNFYKNSGIAQPKHKFDLNPAVPDVIKADCRQLPLHDSSVETLMFDPPFIFTYLGIKTLKMTQRFSNFNSEEELLEMYYDSLKEFLRVLKPNGTLIFKCQDIASTGKNYLNHVNIINMAEELGFTSKDLFILVAKNRIISGRIKQQRHARKFHSYFLVFNKTSKRSRFRNKLVDNGKYNRSSIMKTAWKYYKSNNVRKFSEALVHSWSEAKTVYFKSLGNSKKLPSKKQKNTKKTTSNNISIYKTIGARNHSKTTRQKDDFYATDPRAGEMLLELESFSPKIWECACGEGHLSKVFLNAGHQVKSTDLVDRGFGEPDTDFLKNNLSNWNGDIITNPPYKHAQRFAEKALQIILSGNKVAMLLKLQFLEGMGRKQFLQKYPPKTVYVSSSRLQCAKNGDFKSLKKCGGSAMAFAWYVWEKGFTGNTEVKWFN